MYTNTRPELNTRDARTLPARFYTDPEYFQRELAAVHLKTWLWAGRAQDLPDPGSYFVREVGPASVVVLRDEAGVLQAFHNVCRHRGTLLCKDQAGRVPGRIQCSYHAWTYALDGQLVNAPHMEKVQGFRSEEHSLKPVAVDAWDGHVFIHVGSDPEPLREHLDHLPQLFQPWGMADLVRVERRVYELKANWKLIIQNYSECLHCPIVHPLLHKQSHYMSGENAPPHPSYLGGRMELRDGMATLSLDGTTNRACLPGLGEADKRHVYYYCLLPNLLLNLHPDYMLTFALWPRAVDRTEIVCEWHFHPDEVRKADFDPSGAIEFWDLTNRQDWELSQLAQRGIGSTGYEPGPYSNREELLWALDRWVQERLDENEGRG